MKTLARANPPYLLCYSNILASLHSAPWLLACLRCALNRPNNNKTRTTRRIEFQKSLGDLQERSDSASLPFDASQLLAT